MKINQLSPTAYAKLAGLLYLLIAISGGFSIGYMPSVIMVPGDAATTAQNIIDFFENKIENTKIVKL